MSSEVIIKIHVRAKYPEVGMDGCKNCKKMTNQLRNDGLHNYCRECYGKKALVRCAECDEIITSGVEHRDEYYHKKCFTCAICGKCLAGEQFLIRNNGRFCCECYEKAFSEKCAKCRNTFTGMGDIFYIFYDDRPWHPECFRCSYCRSSLLGKLTVTISNDIFCTSCASYISQ